jgi:DNA polymerase V
MNKQELGARHRQMRETILSMTVADYAALMGVREVTVYSWESGRTRVPHDVVIRLERDHHVSMRWLLTGQGAPDATNITALVTELRRMAPDVVRPARRSDRRTRIRIPMLSLGVSAGSPVASDDVIEREIDLAEMLLEHPDATYFIRVVGDSMHDAGIHDGDTLLVDCATDPKPGQVVIARVYGELTVKRYLLDDGRPLLRAENRRFKDIPITPDMDFAIVGVVRSCIKKL